MSENMNVKIVLEELQCYEVDSWDLRKLFNSAIKQDVKKTYGLYLDDKDIVESDTIEHSVICTVESLKNRYDSIENALLHHEWCSIYSRVRLDEHNDKETKFYVWDNGIYNFIFMIRYAINGFFDKDYSEINEYAAENKINYDVNYGTYKLRNVTFRIFKNRKVVVKGLTEEQYQRIKNGFDIHKKYLNK